MSYILDALKKADTERERRAVPGLHAQADAGYGVGERRRALPWRFIVAGLAVLLAAALAWLWLGRDEPPAPALAVPPTPASPMPSPRPDLAPPPPPAVTAAPPPSPAPVIQEPIAHARPPAGVAQARPPDIAPAASALAAAASGAPARIPSRNELPPELRAALPALNVSGAVYAPQASGRMLFVNGLVLHEGDAVADGLTLERIGPSSSVLVFRGQRFELKY